MARTSASGLVARRPVRFDVPVKGRPAHENPPPQPVRPDLSGPYQFVGLGPSGMHVLLHLGNGHPFAGAARGLAAPGVATVIAFVLSSALLSIPLRAAVYGGVRRVRFPAFYTKVGRRVSQRGCSRFCRVLLVPYPEKGHNEGAAPAGTNCPSGMGASPGR